MEPTPNLGDRDLSARTLLAAGVAVFALWSLRKGKRLPGVLAGLAAFALAYDVSTGAGNVAENLADETEPADEAVQLRCAICNDPIVAGQSRTPNEYGETVHEACLEAPA